MKPRKLMVAAVSVALSTADKISVVGHRDVRIWIVVACIALSLAAYEIAGLTLHGWHTISYEAYLHPWLRIAIGLIFTAGLVWWIWHSGHPHER